MTAQISETLILDGKTYAMTFCPPLPTQRGTIVPVRDVESEKRKPRLGERTAIGSNAPDTISVLVARWTDDDGTKHEEEVPSIIYSTACWRRYQGTWEIRDGRFYLVKLVGSVRLAKEEPLLADWFTGVLRLPEGDMLHYVHMGFGSVFERERHIMIERGKVTGQRVLDNTGDSHDPDQLGWDNLPGNENRFRGDRDFN